MPYVSDPNLDENQQPQGTNSATQPAGQVSGQPQSVSGATGTQSKIQNQNSATEAPEAPTLASGIGTPSGGIGQGGKAPAYNPTAPTSSGQWVNLQNYLNANNGGQFGQDFSGKVGSDVSGAQTAISKASSDFGNAVDSGTIQNNQNVLDEVGKSPQTMSNDDQAAFKKQFNGSYQGPQNTASDTNFQNANEKAHSAFSESQQARTPGGQSALLKKFYADPNYTPGGQALDSAILSADPNAQAAIASLARDAGNLPVSYQATERAANDKAAGGAATSAAAHQAAVDALYGTGGSATDIKGGAIGNIQKGVTDRVASDNASIDPNYQAVLEALKSNNLSSLTADQKKWLGDVSSFKGGLYGVDPTQYLQETTANVTPNTAITPEEEAKLAALYSLAGTENTFAPDASKAGTVPSPYTFNNSKDNGFQSAVNAAKASWENNVTAAKNQRADLWNQLQQVKTVQDELPSQYRGEPTQDQETALASQIADYNNQLRQLYNQAGAQYDFATGKQIADKPEYQGDLDTSFTKWI